MKHAWKLTAADDASAKWVCRTCGITKLSQNRAGDFPRVTYRRITAKSDVGIVWDVQSKAPPCAVQHG